MMMGQYWLGATKPKKAFRSTRNAFNISCYRILKFYLTEFSTACLPACHPACLRDAFRPA